MPYLGNTPSTSFATVVKDSFSGDGSTVAFTLSKVATTNSVSVFVENVRQEPTTAYAVSGTTLTFTAAPVTSSGNNIYVLHMNPTTTTTHPAAQNLTAVDGTFTGTVTAGSTLDMNGTELILDADADTSITADTDDQVDIKVAGSDLAHITSTYAKLRGATPLVFGENNSTGTFQSISGEVGANNLLLRSYQSLTFKNGTSGSSLTDGTTAFNIDTNGHVTMPKQPVWWAYNGSNNNYTFSSADSYEQMTFTNETLDKNSDFASNTFTAPVDGTYYVNSVHMFNASSSGTVRTDLAIYVNSSLILYKQNKGDNYVTAHSVQISGLVDCDANDTIKVYARVNNTKGRIYLAQTTATFQGYLVA